MFLLVPLGLVLLVLGVGAADVGAAEREQDQSILRLSPKSDNNAFPAAYEAIDGLESGTVLRVRVEEFAEYAEGVAAQCVHRAKAIKCGNAFPVQFDANGNAFFQYQLRDDFHANAVAGGRCHAGAARCTLIVHDEQRDTTAAIDTIFHDRLPAPGRIRVTPKSALSDGQKVTVSVAGYPAGAQVDAMLCAAPDATGSARCGAPGPSAPLVVGPDGTGTSTLVVKEGPVGTQRIACGRDAVCGISVASTNVFTRRAGRPDLLRVTRRCRVQQQPRGHRSRARGSLARTCDLVRPPHRLVTSRRSRGAGDRRCRVCRPRRDHRRPPA